MPHTMQKHFKLDLFYASYNINQLYSFSYSISATWNNFGRKDSILEKNLSWQFRCLESEKIVKTVSDDIILQHIFITYGCLHIMCNLYRYRRSTLHEC